MLGFTCTILVTWEGSLLWVDPSFTTEMARAIDESRSLFTTGLTKCVVLIKTLWDELEVLTSR